MSFYSDYVSGLLPVAYWRLGESVGATTAVDETTNYDGTYVGPPTLGEPGLITDDPDTAIAIASSGQYVNVGAPLEINVNTVMSLVCSINIGSAVAYRAILSRADVPGLALGYTFEVDATQHLRLFVRHTNGSNELDYNMTSPITPGQTYHVVFVVDGAGAAGTRRIYVNGVNQALTLKDNTLTSDPTYTSIDTYIGNRPSDTSHGLDGTIDDVAIFSDALTQAQVTGLYDASLSQDVDAQAAGTFSGIVSSAALTVDFPHTATTDGVFGSITGISAVDVNNPHNCSVDGIFGSITGSSAVDITFEPISVVTDGVLSEITGAADLDIVIQPAEASVAGTFSSIVGRSYLYDPGETDLVLLVGDVAVEHSVIQGAIEISRAENEESILSVSLVAEPGVQDVSAWISKSIILEVGGNRVFSGTINSPILDVVNKKVDLSCTDDRNKKINELPTAVVDSIGFYSESIFNKKANNTEIIEQRLTTTPESLDFDEYGNHVISNIIPKSVSDITLTGSDIYRKSVEVSLTSAQRVINQANIIFDYRYTRLRQRNRVFKIEDLPFCDILDLGALGSFTLKDTFIGYSNMMNWPVDPTSIIWEEMPFSTGSTSPPCTVDVVYIQNPRFATSMTYVASKRFAQTVTERFNVAIKAPQSITTYGLKTWQQESGHEFEYDSTQFEGDAGYIPPTGMSASDSDYYTDEEGSQTDFENAILTAMNIGYTKVIRTHRDTKIAFETPLRVDIDTSKTVDIVSSELTAKGKVSAISHIFNIDNRHNKTRIEISFSSSEGAQVSDAITVPPRVTPPVVADAWSDPFVMLITDGEVVTPEIDETSRQNQISESDTTYNVEITNDPFQVSM